MSFETYSLCSIARLAVLHELGWKMIGRRTWIGLGSMMLFPKLFPGPSRELFFFAKVLPCGVTLHLFPPFKGVTEEWLIFYAGTPKVLLHKFKMDPGEKADRISSHILDLTCRFPPPLCDSDNPTI